MKMWNRRGNRRRVTALAGIIGGAALMTACAGGGGGGGTGGTGDSTVHVAFIGSQTTTFQQAIFDGLSSVDGIDAEFIEVGYDEAKQAQAIDDAVASGRFQGIVTLPNSPTGLIAAATRAIDAGVQFINVEAQFGPDPLDVGVQVDGQAASIVTRYDDYATLQWQAALQYCEDAGIDPCNVARIDGLPQFATATLFDQADSAAAEEAGDTANRIETIFAGGYDATVGLKAGQDLLTAHPETNVILSNDPLLQGIQEAVSASGRDVAMIGIGGQQFGIDNVRDGVYYAEVALFPETAGELAGEAMLRHVADPSLAGETISPLPDDIETPLFTKDTLGDFVAQYE